MWIVTFGGVPILAFKSQNRAIEYIDKCWASKSHMLEKVFADNNTTEIQRLLGEMNYNLYEVPIGA